MGLNNMGVGFVIKAQNLASPTFKKVSNDFGKMADKTASKAQKQQKAMQSIGKGIGLIYGSMRAMQPFKAALEDSRRFGTAIKEVATLTDEATFPMKEMERVTMDMARTFGGDATDQAKALYQTISSGYGEVSDATGLMEAANKLAIGGVADVSMSLDGLTNVMNAYASAELDATDVSDAFFVAVKDGKTTVEELASAVGKVAPTAEDSGIKMHELMGSLAAITTKGIKTTEAVSGLKAAISNIAKPSAEAKEEAKRLGIEFDKSSLKTKGLAGFLDQLQGNSKMTDDSINKLFGSVEAVNAVLALTAGEGEKFNQILKDMETRAGATDKAYTKMTKSFDHQMKVSAGIRGNISKMFGGAIKAMIAPLVKLFNAVSGGFEKLLSALPPGARKAIVSVIGAIGGFVAAAGGIMAIRGALSLLGIDLGGIAKTFLMLPLIIIPAALALGTLGIAFYGAYKAIKKTKGNFEFTWKDFTRQLKIGWEGVIQLISSGKLSDSMKKELDKAGNSTVKNFLKGFENFLGKMKYFWDGLKKGFEAGIEKLADSSAMKRLLTVLEGFFGMFTGEPMKASQAELDTWADKGISAGEKLATLGETGLSVIQTMMEMGSSFMKAMSNLTAKDVVEGINGVINVFKMINDVFNVTATGIQMIGGSFRMVGSIIYDVLHLLFGGLKAVIDLVEGGLEAVFTGDTGAVKAAAKWTEDWAGNLFEQTSNAGSYLYDVGANEAGRVAGGGDTRRPEFASQKPKVTQENYKKFMSTSGVDMTMGQAQKRREGILKWMKTSTADYKKQAPGLKSWEDAPMEMREGYINELKLLNKNIIKLGGRAIEVNIDGEKAGEEIKKTPAFSGDESLDEVVVG